jgi:hypothetical protein
MRPRVESLLLVSCPAVAVLLAVGCAGRDLGFRPGSSDVAPPAMSVSSPAASVRLPRWERFGELGGLKEIASNSPSRGHGTGEWTGQIRGNDKASASTDVVRAGGKMPQGALLVELHNDKRTGALLEAFVMEKREEGFYPAGGVWEYLVVGNDGTAQQRGRIDFCARCHSEAASGFVFLRAASGP